MRFTSRLSYSARPAFHNAWKNSAVDHCTNFWCTALALPKRSLGSAFHWRPVLGAYTMASKTNRGALGGRPAPVLRRCFLGRALAAVPRVLLGPRIHPPLPSNGHGLWPSVLTAPSEGRLRSRDYFIYGQILSNRAPAWIKPDL